VNINWQFAVFLIDPVWPQNPTSKGKKTETSTSKKLVHLIPEIILAKLSITKGVQFLFTI
jgi:hypothetical protein